MCFTEPEGNKSLFSFYRCDQSDPRLEISDCTKFSVLFNMTRGFQCLPVFVPFLGSDRDHERSSGETESEHC